MSISRERVADNFSRAAERYDGLAAHQNDWMREAMELAFAHVPAAATILDIGCGTGSFAQQAKQRRPRWQVVGSDIAPGMLAIAATRCDAVFQASADALPSADASFDAVFSSLALQWLDDKRRVFEEIARVLKPGGCVVMVSLGDQNLRELRALTQAHGIDTLRMDRLAYYADAAQAAGLSVLFQASKPQVITYASAKELLASMKAIGAGNAEGDPAKREHMHKAIGAVIAQYDTRHATEGGVLATWEPIYMVAKKA